MTAMRKRDEDSKWPYYRIYKKLITVLTESFSVFWQRAPRLFPNWSGFVFVFFFFDGDRNMAERCTGHIGEKQRAVFSISLVVVWLRAHAALPYEPLSKATVYMEDVTNIAYLKIALLQFFSCNRIKAKNSNLKSLYILTPWSTEF